MSIKLEKVFYTYSSNAAQDIHALYDVSLEVKEGDFIGIIGHTGSGKSTLIQHFNRLLVPSMGKVYVDEIDITAKGIDLKEIRHKVGLVFQYPEHQLFEETVSEDIAFGPKNLGIPDTQIKKRVKRAMGLVHLDYNKYKDMSPFLLSGGEKRRVALAGVLAMEPKYLILDEPTAGLDPKGRDEILQHVVELHMKGITVVLVSHSMEEVARLTNRLIVMDQGKIVYDDEPRKVFSEHQSLQRIGLDVPIVTKLMVKLKEKGWSVRTDVLTINEARNEISRYLRGDAGNA